MCCQRCSPWAIRKMSRLIGVSCNRPQCYRKAWEWPAGAAGWQQNRVKNNIKSLSNFRIFHLLKDRFRHSLTMHFQAVDTVYLFTEKALWGMAFMLFCWCRLMAEKALFWWWITYQYLIDVILKYSFLYGSYSREKTQSPAVQKKEYAPDSDTPQPDGSGFPEIEDTGGSGSRRFAGSSSHARSGGQPKIEPSGMVSGGLKIHHSSRPDKWQGPGRVPVLFM